MLEEDVRHLHDWLSEAAIKLYGNSPEEQADLVDRTSAVLRNSQLTSSIFHYFEESSGMNVSHKLDSISCLHLIISALPAPLCSLLDDVSLRFLHELWRVLKRDEPLTALELLHPGVEAASGGDTCGEDVCQMACARPDTSKTRAVSRDHWQRQEAVRAWVEAKVIELQGFTDEVNSPKQSAMFHMIGPVGANKPTCPTPVRVCGRSLSTQC